MNVCKFYSTNGIKCLTRRHFGLRCLKIPGENTVCTYVCASESNINIMYIQYIRMYVCANIRKYVILCTVHTYVLKKLNCSNNGMLCFS